MTPLVRLADVPSKDISYEIEIMGEDMKSTLRLEGMRDPVEAVTRAYRIANKEGHPVQIHRLRSVPVKEAMLVVWPNGFWGKK